MKARLPQGYGGGPGNMTQMIKQAQKMQEQMAAKQAELEEQEYTVTTGGGAVKVVITGKKEFKSFILQPDIVDPDDIEMLQDLIISAANEAIRKVEETAAKEMEGITSSLNIPGMF